jgi:ankyrin repeat protein
MLIFLLKAVFFILFVPCSPMSNEVLTHAYNNNSFEIIKQALDAGADPNLLLQKSIGDTHPDIVDLLLSYGANPNLDTRPPQNETTLHYAIAKLDQPFPTITKDIIISLLGYGADPNARSNTSIGGSWLPLHWLAERVSSWNSYPDSSTNFINFEQIIESLFYHGADPHASELYQISLLTMCAQRNNSQMSRLLIKHGVSPTKTFAHNQSSTTDSHTLMIKNIPLKTHLEQFFQPLTRACVDGNLNLLKKQFATTDSHLKGPTISCWTRLKNFVHSKPLRKTAGSGMTPLHWAAAQGQCATVDFLLSKKLHPNALCETQDTPADLAVRNGHLHCAKAILKAGGSFNTQGWLHAAIHRRDQEDIKTLLQNSPKLMRERDNKGNIPLHIAGAQPHTPMLESLPYCQEDFYVRNHQNITPLQIVFTNVRPGDLLVLSTKILEPALAVLAKSEIEAVACVGNIPEIRTYLANELAHEHLKKYNNSRILKNRSLSVIKTLQALRSTTSLS